MLEYVEQQKKLTINQWKIFAAATIGDMLDFFDFLLIAFVLAFIVKDWNLTYGESGARLSALVRWDRTVPCETCCHLGSWGRALSQPSCRLLLAPIRAAMFIQKRAQCEILGTRPSSV